MFDTSKEFAFPLRLPDGNRAEVAVRWPTDVEWAERKKATKIIITQLGRGNQQREFVPSPEADLKLFDAIKLNGAPAITGEEAGRLLNVLGNADIRDVKLEGNTAIVTLALVDGSELQHHLRVPSAKQRRALDDAAVRQRSLPHNRSEVRVLLEPGAKLWDDCDGKSTDYRDGIVPANHKDTAVRAVIDELDNELTSAFAETADF